MKHSVGCVTGRFQPVHQQHLELFDIALVECAYLIVAVTNPDTSARREEATSPHRHIPAANPFTYYERVRLLLAALTDHVGSGRVCVVPFNLTQPQLWPQYVPLHARQYVRTYGDWERRKADMLAGAGYAVTLLDGDPTCKVDATHIRRLLNSGEAWTGAVLPAVVPVLSELLTSTPMQDRG